MLHDARLSPVQVARLAEWCEPGEMMADVEVRVDDGVLTASQGDEQQSWDRDGKPVPTPPVAAAAASGVHAAARYHIAIERYGALGIPEWRDELSDTGFAEVRAGVMRHLTTLGPLDSLTVAVQRTRT